MATVQKEKDVSEIKLPYKLIPFMRYRFIGFGFSFIVTALCIFSIVTKGFNWGLDFTGGTVIETSFSQPAGKSACLFRKRRLWQCLSANHG